MSPEEVHAAEQDYSDRVVASMDAQMAGEARDPVWGLETERAVTSTIAGLASKGFRIRSKVS